MYFLLNMGICQPAMLVYQKVSMVFSTPLTPSKTAIRAIKNPNITLVGCLNGWLHLATPPSNVPFPPSLKRMALLTIARWWFQTFFIFTPTWGRFPFWQIFFQRGGWTTRLVSLKPAMVETKVDLNDFEAWLCDCPAGTYGPNGSHCHWARLRRGWWLTGLGAEVDMGPNGISWLFI